jgi:hypothetical protein
MLATMADVVFLVDASASAINFQTIEWLDAIASQLDTTLRVSNDVDMRYGVVAFGQQYDNLTHRAAHSHVVDLNGAGTVFERLWSASDHLSDLQASLTSLDEAAQGGVEDGWDAIDHAIAEYDFRPGAVPVFILVQSNEGRNIYDSNGTTVRQNGTLTHEGVLAALESKNVILNTLVVGPVDEFNSRQPLFNLSNYGLSSDIRILGVEASASGKGQHAYHGFDTSTNTVPGTLPETESQALQVSYNGSNTGATGMVGTGKSILIGKNINGDFGPTAAGYSAKSVPFQTVLVSQSDPSVPFGSAVTFPGTAGFTFNGTVYGTSGAPSNQRIYVNQDGTITFGAPEFKWRQRRSIADGIGSNSSDHADGCSVMGRLSKRFRSPKGGRCRWGRVGRFGASMAGLVPPQRNAGSSRLPSYPLRKWQHSI